MPINNKKFTKSTSRPVNSKAIIFLKLLILFMILILPLFFWALSLNRAVLLNSLSKKTTQNNLALPADSNEFNFVATIPVAQAGNLANVPKEKLDSLFNKLKK